MCNHKIDETFIPFIGFEGKYEINRLGVVKSIERMSNKYSSGKAAGSSHKVKGRIKKMTPSTQPDSKNSHKRKPYLVFNLNHKNRKYLHRELAIHFIPNPNEYTTVDHIDRNPLNNCLCNLRWVDIRINSVNSSRYSKKHNARGVGYYPKLNKYQARIKMNGKIVELGTLTKDKILAMKEYDNLVMKYVPEHGVTNEMLGLYKINKQTNE